MGLEQKIKERNKKANLKKIILQTVVSTGMISLALVAPKVIGAMKKTGLMPHMRQRESIYRSRVRLVKEGLLKYQNNKLMITEKGKTFLFKNLSLQDNKQLHKRWDGKWRVLIFDIPEKRRRDRTLIRKNLLLVGFMRLQNSVWVYPYDCEDFITLLKADLKIGRDVLYMVVEALEYDKPVLAHFGLLSYQ